MRRVVLSAMVLVGAVAGCGGGGGLRNDASGGGADGGDSAETGPPPAVSLDDFPAAYAAVLCDRNFQCSRPEDIGDRTKEDCLDANESLVRLIVTELRASQNVGRVVYDGVEMAVCIATLASLSCSEWATGLAQPPACDEALVPKVATGGACLQDFECLEGACVKPSATIEGVCKATVAHGQACAIEDTCVLGEYCDGVCKTKKVSGTVCIGSVECGYACNDETKRCSTYAGW